MMRALFLLGGLMGASLAFGAQKTTVSYTSNGRPIEVEMFSPATPGKHPAVLFLHGADGMRYRAGEYQHFADLLADRGYVVLLVHYFNSTGTTFADADHIFREFMIYAKTVDDGVAFAASRPNVDPERIGMVGISLGASLSVAVSSQDERVKGVVEYFGGMPDFAAPFIRRLPPTLILHGTADRIVPVDNADRIEQFAKNVGATVEKKIYPGQGHGFTGEANEDAARRAVAWLNKYVMGAAETASR